LNFDIDRQNSKWISKSQMMAEVTVAVGTKTQHNKTDNLSIQRFMDTPKEAENVRKHN